MKDELLKFLNKEDFCVISSLSAAGKPQSAMVAFTHSDKLELLIGTSNKTRKYQSITVNPNVSVVIGFSGDANIQYEGTAQQIAKAEFPSLTERGFTELPGNDKYRQDPDEAWFLITPQWLRFTVHGENYSVTETRDFS